VSASYLLPCRCGEQHVVEPPRAGETIVCSCGALVQIPTMLEMAALEPAPAPSAALPVAATWDWRHRMLLLGIVCLSAAICLGVWFYRHRPIAAADVIDPEQIRQNFQQFPPTQTWEIWEGMKQGLGRNDPRYEAAVLQFHIKEDAAIVLGFVGVALLVAAAATRRKEDKETGR
jgi:hypothetical protein